ncbi:hypothetical protein B9Z55_011546 [Caenorhabditis nigoni]|uniref:Coiled-coil domain-containing protein 25 n=1 Tax=Caenorhabditis nigoni TaxID=1611254 RepID=A0A2G5UKG8_9PELO|nr:hypothetical protein B9Z55_011546 [Caenorhabditis nigoni]
MPRGMTIDTIPEELLEECCQLVKANSKIGKKLDKTTVVYTKRENLKKTKMMNSGEVRKHFQPKNQDPGIRESGSPGILESGNPGIRESGNPGIQES